MRGFKTEISLSKSQMQPYAFRGTIKIINYFRLENPSKCFRVKIVRFGRIVKGMFWSEDIDVKQTNIIFS